ncbi:Leucine-rich repeat-containing protein 56 [Pleodorina starrii]|uniref:Leucine-rich repeat-containing protein 56 n=1 Tax=Pleodorina starrii TaxID=330485 RepID=A0A9W6F021_9CHLO|nr:Leucine-rich repeat-containing protein 56 [Pleodorina starrii]GLC50880.1 Leucine-rich repeat-containing protein 56 [Pleodorina starrii]GLC73924.1 Leucine-rich repeat-containing protein 56 [Pleodorina starrii]
MSARRLSSRAGSAEGTAVLARGNSLSGLTDDVIRSATQRFDIEIVFKLSWVNKGLTRMSGLDKCINLVELNLTGNQITKIEGLESVLQLRRLILTSNRISCVEGLSQLSRLEGLWLQDNKLASLESLALPDLAQLAGLRSLYLQNLDRSAPNAVCRTPGYKAAVLAALPNLTNLDGERSPGSLNYAELAAEFDAFRANPTAPKQWPLPEVAPWLAGVSTEVPMGGGPGEAALQQKHAKVVKVIDECEMLVRVLGDEIGKFGRQMEAKKAAA